jgi:malate dehydrogenase (oxaloacetate-decarboxylating)(NADP+)
MSQRKIRKEDALRYHSAFPPGKIEVTPTKPLTTQRDLALAYSPGVAEPCLEIRDNPEHVFNYTSKGNLVGVISNGTAVLGLGNIGALASKPVMEGKGVLFKKFAGIDCFDIEIDCEDPDEFIRIVKSLEPTFGGINLEDIKAPESFKIETELKAKCKIPVMHDDQHGTAIISAAALINALEITQRKIDEIYMVVLGAGTAAIACTRFYISLGLNPNNVVMVDKDGVIRKDSMRTDDPKFEFATDKNLRTLDEAISGADVFLGLSAANLLTPEHLKKMAPDPIVFALANPNPEIDYELAMATRDDIIMATGRSDYPNQVNNVLGFPYIFRGALDVRATAINEEMKLAATHALAALAKDSVPDTVYRAYGNNKLAFGREYLIPKPLDPRLIITVAPAVAKAAMDSGVAKFPITNWEQYETDLLHRVGMSQKLMTKVVARAKNEPKRVIFAEADHYKILKAAQIIQDEKIGVPILLGNKKKINQLITDHSLDLSTCLILDPREETEAVERYSNVLYERRKRKGMTLYDAGKVMQDRNYFGAGMLNEHAGDVLISGLTKDYAQTIKPALRIIGVAEGARRVAGMYIVNTKKETYFFADTTVNVDPGVEELVDIIGLTAEKVRFFGEVPRIAVLSYSNFGSNPGPETNKIQAAIQEAKRRWPELVIDGEVQANIALNPVLMKEHYPFSELADKGANTLIFPNLAAGNIAYKIMQELGGAEVIGPVLMGMRKPVHILQLGSSVREIVNMVAIGIADAQTLNGNR